jgi:hypothetical protein
MSRAKTFKLADATRAWRAATAAKIDVDRMEIGKDGVIRIFPRTLNDPVKREPPNEWDEVLPNGTTAPEIR